MPLLYSHFKTLVLQNLNWIDDHYFEMAVAGGEEEEVDDQQTADAILSINYRDKVGQIQFENKSDLRFLNKLGLIKAEFAQILISCFRTAT